MSERLFLLFRSIRERLWIKPLIVCGVSIAAAYLASLTDVVGIGQVVPDVAKESIEELLKIVAASMLVIATFAVGSMVAAYASASGPATPRSFSLVISDDVSQNALSTFIGGFIFSIVALIALMNGFYGKAGRFTLFALTVLVFVLVILSFVRWVDSIARLGRLGSTIVKVEKAARLALERRKAGPHMGGVPALTSVPENGAVYGASVGYVQHIDVEALQCQAEKAQLRLTVAALPGTFCLPGRPVAYVTPDKQVELTREDREAIQKAFKIGDVRAFDYDPRFGLVVLSEIASRALSPAVNDPGTAIQVTGSLVRLLSLWDGSGDQTADPKVRFDRVAVPRLALRDMFEDAFTGIARDGAGTVEVAVRLQKALESLAMTGSPEMRENACLQARQALIRSENAMQVSFDVKAVRSAAAFSASGAGDRGDPG